MSYEIITPTGIDRAIMRILEKHTGREKAIKRPALLEILYSIGYTDVTDRQMRKAINDLRKKGNLICSVASENGGYYMAASLSEFDEFVQRELGAKIADMSHTLKSMTESAQRQFGDSYQMSLV